MPVEPYEDDDEEQEGPRSSFGTYLAEGDALFKQSEYKKALESYSLALELQPNDKTCLVARSKCYLKLGDPQKALQDAEDALAEDKEFNRGLYRKAEALYCMGDFEYALMYYHRGHKLRPELDEFRLGIQKAQEAIDNSIGSAAKIKLENKGDLSFFTKQDDIGSKKRPAYMKPAAGKKPQPLMANRKKEVKSMAPSKKTVKQLLGELYSDKEYFEKLMEDEAFIKKNSHNNHIYDLVQGGLNYLETRTEFWRQQKPLYARKKEKAKYNVPRKKNKPSVSKFVLKQLEEVDQALSGGDPDRSLRLAQKLLKSVEGIAREDLGNKVEVIANIHSCIGNAYIELEQLTKALRHHEKDLNLSREWFKESKSRDGESRALDNIGRVHARMGNFRKAVDSWNQKLPLVSSSLESTWLCHEIGRCHLELGNNQSAKDFGKKSLVAGKDCEDTVWQLNATVLVAQSEVKLGEVESAIETFSNALELAVSLEDNSAQAAISKALSELQRRSASRPSPGRTSQASDQYLSEEEVTLRVPSVTEDKTSNASDEKEPDEESEPQYSTDTDHVVDASDRGTEDEGTTDVSEDVTLQTDSDVGAYSRDLVKDAIAHVQEDEDTSLTENGNTASESDPSVTESKAADTDESTAEVVQNVEVLPTSETDAVDADEGDIKEPDVTAEKDVADTAMTSNVLTSNELDRESSANQLSVNPSYSDNDFEEDLSTDPSAVDMAPVESTDNIEDVPTPVVSAEDLISPIASDAYSTDVQPSDATMDAPTESVTAVTSTEEVSDTVSTVTAVTSTEEVTDAASTVTAVTSTEEVTDAASNETLETAEEIPVDTSKESVVDSEVGKESDGGAESVAEDVTLVPEEEDLSKDISAVSEVEVSEEVTEDTQPSSEVAATAEASASADSSAATAITVSEEASEPAAVDTAVDSATEEASAVGEDISATETSAAEEISAAETSVDEDVSATETSVTEDVSAEEKPVVEDAPAVDTPVSEDAPGTEISVAEDAPAAETSVAVDAPAAETSVAEDAAAAETSVAEDAPAVETSGAEDSPAAEASNAEDAPAAEISVAEDAPAAEVSVTEDAPAAETSVAEDAPVVETSDAEVAPTVETSGVEDAPAAETSVAEDAPAAEASNAEDAPAAEISVAEDAPATETNEVGTEQTSTTEEVSSSLSTTDLSSTIGDVSSSDDTPR